MIFSVPQEKKRKKKCVMGVRVSFTNRAVGEQKTKKVKKKQSTYVKLLEQSRMYCKKNQSFLQQETQNATVKGCKLVNQVIIKI